MPFNNAVNATQTGFQSITAGGVWNGRTLTAGTGISITNGDGTAGNPVISSTGGFNPGTTIQLFDDFVDWAFDSSVGGVLLSQVQWLGSGSTFTVSPAANDAGHPGCLGHIATTVGITNGVMFVGNSAVNTNPTSMPFLVGGGAIQLDWVFNTGALSTGTNTYILQIGFNDNNGAAGTFPPPNGIFFGYTNAINSGQWTCTTRSAGTPTTTNSATAVTTGWHHATININAAGTSVAFTMDGVLLATNTTNIPALPVGPCCLEKVTAGTVPADAMKIDLFYLTQTLTTPR